MLALCLMLLGTYYTLPIMLALCLMLLGTYYAQNYAGIISRSLPSAIKDVLTGPSFMLIRIPEYTVFAKYFAVWCGIIDPINT